MVVQQGKLMNKTEKILKDFENETLGGLGEVNMEVRTVIWSNGLFLLDSIEDSLDGSIKD
jgi:hypothetical protein